MKKIYFLHALYAVVILAAALTAYKYWSLDQTLQTARNAKLGQSEGNVQSDKVLVAFIDYKCPSCRLAHGTMQDLVKQDPELKIVYRHVISGEDSMKLADMALAAAKQGRFNEAHDFLMTRNVMPREQEIRRFAQRLGLDYETLITDMTSADVGAVLLRNVELMQSLNIRATPSYLIGKTVYVPRSGMPAANDFRRMIDSAHKQESDPS